MAKYVYMSVGQRHANGNFINPKTKKETHQMRFRGEVPDDYDTSSHEAWMAANGHKVEVHNKLVGEMTSSIGLGGRTVWHREYPMSAKF